MLGATISDNEFDRLRRFFEGASGIKLADSKKVLVCGRLSKRLRHWGLQTYREYIDFIEAKRLNYNMGNAVKYITRADHKGNRKQDLEKAIWYLRRELDHSL